METAGCCEKNPQYFSRKVSNMNKSKYVTSNMNVYRYIEGRFPSGLLFGLICQHSDPFCICIIVDEGVGGDTSARGRKYWSLLDTLLRDNHLTPCLRL